MHLQLFMLKLKFADDGDSFPRGGGMLKIKNKVCGPLVDNLS